MNNQDSNSRDERRDSVEQLEVAFLPWLGINREITVGPVTLVPYEPGTVAESSVREYLERYFPRYMEVDGTPVRDVLIAKHASVTGFRHHTDVERGALARAAACLAFSTITAAWVLRLVHRNEVPAPSADSFQLLFQRFTPGSNFVGVSAGRASHGWPLDQVMFTRPWASSAVFGNPDQYILEGLGTLLIRPEMASRDFVERVWRSVEWFRLAHLDGADQTDEAKLVAMATAFESLFDLPDFGKQQEFARKIEALVFDAEMRRDVRVKRSGDQLDLSLAGCWGWDFYEIRSRLVHGDEVPAMDFQSASGMPHLVVADLVFRECILRQLFELGCLGANIHEAAASLDRNLANVPEGPEPFDPLEWAINVYLEFGPIHKVLGWSQTPSLPEV